MGDPKAFLTIPRKEAGYRPIHDRIHDFGEVEQTLNSGDRRLQASRCMDCGVPFCHWACPLGNRPPEWNDALSRGDWELAYRLLSSTNDFPEFTGRICPALCEQACVLNLVSHQPTTNRENEAAITEHAFAEHYVHPCPPHRRLGLHVAVIGCGPAGLVAASRLNRLGYNVTAFDKCEAAGGLLRYGIPNFKLNKAVIDRRLSLLRAEGITFHLSTFIDLLRLPPDFDAYVVATGTPIARDLSVPGRNLKGIYPALTLLSQQNRLLYGTLPSGEELVNARDLNVVVIGGGDTGSDCVGTVRRQGCRSVTQIELLPPPPPGPDDANHPWPAWPRILRTTSSHEEGCVRRWNLNTLRFLGRGGRVTGVRVQEVKWNASSERGGDFSMEPVGSVEDLPADMVLLALGFLRAELPVFGPNVFVAGDAVSGASLVVRAMASGAEVAAKVHRFLEGR